MNDPTSILVSVPNWVGDVVMATAALRTIRQRFGQARIVHLMRPYVREVLSGTNFCDDEVFWPQPGVKGTGRGGLLTLVRQLRTHRFDLAILLTNSFRSALVVRLAGARRRVGYARDGRGWLLTDRLKPQRKEAGQQSRGRYLPLPALDYYNALAEHVGCPPPGDRLQLATSAEDEAAIDRRLGPLDPDRPLVVLNPGANYGSAKCWPAESYAELADELVTRHGARVVASLGPKEQAIAERLQAAVRQPVEIFVEPPLGLGPLKALIRRCRLLVTNDTGPRHFATAFDVPVVTVFGSSDPAWTDTRFAKERIVSLDLDCRPCMERTCPLQHHRCMQDLPPAAVLEKAAELLQKTPKRQNAKTPKPENAETAKRQGGPSLQRWGRESSPQSAIRNQQSSIVNRQSPIPNPQSFSMFARDSLLIDPPFAKHLGRARLDTVAAVLACPGDRLAAWSRTSDTILVRLPQSSSSVYLKRYHYPRWRQRLRGMLRGTFLHASRARSEYRALMLMRRLGIQAVRPVAFGERRIGHFVRSCFLITEAVPDAMPLSSFIKTFGHRHTSSQAVRARREILTSLARQVRQMHEAGFVHRDLFWRNVLIRLLPDRRFEFYFLDVSVGRRIRLPSRRRESIVRDIAAMAALAPDFCSKADQLRFLLEYLDTPRISLQDRHWLRRVRARSDRIRDSELQRLSRGAVFDPPIGVATGTA